MVQIKQYKPSNHLIKSMIAGDTGAGKTTFASTACKPIFLCTENGLLSIADKNPLMIEIDSVAALRDSIKLLKEDKSGDFDTIVVDSLSEMSQVIKDRITNNGQSPMTMREWGVLGDTLMGLFRQIVDLPYHIIFLCHIQEETSEDGNEKYLNIALSGKSKTEVLRAFDVIGYIQVSKDGERTINVKENSYSKAKCRSQILREVPQLPFDFCQWVELMKQTEIGESVVVKEVEDSKPAPTPAVAEMWEKVELKLMGDSGEATKNNLLQSAMNSKKIGDEEKEWIMEKINLYQ